MKMLSLLLTSATLLCGALSMRAIAALAPPDEAFIKVAAQHAMTEIRLGEVAKTKAARLEVKELGEMLASDHSKANEALRKLAEAKGVTIPDNLTAEYQDSVDRFNQLSGREFDKAFMDEMVAGHEKSVAAFEAALKAAQDSELKAFLEKTLPTLREHLKRCQVLQKGITE